MFNYIKLPADELRGKRFCPGENRVGDPFLSNLVPGGGWKAELKDFEMAAPPPGEVSEAEVVTEEEVEEEEEEDAAVETAAAKKGRKAPAAAAAKGCRGSMPKWCSPKAAAWGFCPAAAAMWERAKGRPGKPSMAVGVVPAAAVVGTAAPEAAAARLAAARPRLAAANGFVAAKSFRSPP